MPKQGFLNLSEVKKQRLLKKAKTLFSRVGIDEISSNEVIDGLGISRGSFYIYFENKDDMYEYLIRDTGLVLYNKFQDEINNLNNLSIFDIVNAVFRFYTEDERGIAEYGFIKKLREEIPNIVMDIINEHLLGEKNNKALYKYYLNYNKNFENSEMMFNSLVRLMYSSLFDSLREYYEENANTDKVRQCYKVKMAILKNGFAYICHRASFFETSDRLDYVLNGDGLM
ncbi:MAG: TetR/AcrR family transcriptional regulator [Clostridia bacterium]|nr:TetR/AcrR family transcriptional regulator [Clostridia bacterium]